MIISRQHSCFWSKSFDLGHGRDTSHPFLQFFSVSVVSPAVPTNLPDLNKMLLLQLDSARRPRLSLTHSLLLEPKTAVGFRETLNSQMSAKAFSSEAVPVRKPYGMSCGTYKACLIVHFLVIHYLSRLVASPCSTDERTKCRTDASS